MEIGLIGLGNMGAPMARNLLKAGHSLTVWNRTREKAEALGPDGAKVADTPADCCDAPVVITMLSEDSTVEPATFGPDGILERLAPGSLHICMATISVPFAERLVAAHKDKGLRYLSAPVMGRPEFAASAQLSVLAAGPDSDIAEAQPIFDAIGRQTLTIGPDAPMANVIKLSVNFLVVSAIESMGEAFALIRKAGVDPDIYADLLVKTLFPSPVYQAYGGMIAQEAYVPAGFRMPLGLKDIRLALEAAEALDVPMPTASVIRDRFVAALASGYDDHDWGGLGRVAADQAGLNKD